MPYTGNMIFFFLICDLCWSQFWPDIHKWYTKTPLIVVTTHLTPFVALRYVALFSRSQGSDITPPPTHTHTHKHTQRMVVFGANSGRARIVINIWKQNTDSAAYPRSRWLHRSFSCSGSRIHSQIARSAAAVRRSHGLPTQIRRANFRQRRRANSEQTVSWLIDRGNSQTHNWYRRTDLPIPNW